MAMRQDLQHAVELVAGGRSYSEAAAEAGLSRSAVAGACFRAGLRVAHAERVRKLHADPQFKAARGKKRREWEERNGRPWGRRDAQARRHLGAPCAECGGPESDHQANYYCPEYRAPNR